MLCCGALLGECQRAARRLKKGVDVGVINARFVKPLDTAVIEPRVRQGRFVVTVKKGA